MRQKRSIQKFLACLLMVLCTISFAPKSFFHDVIATHTDATNCEHPLQKVGCLHKQGFHCAFNDLVVTAPYLSIATSYNFILAEFFPIHKSEFLSSFFQLYFFSAKTRGPPAVV